MTTRAALTRTVTVPYDCPYCAAQNELTVTITHDSRPPHQACAPWDHDDGDDAEWTVSDSVTCEACNEESRPIWFYSNPTVEKAVAVAEWADQLDRADAAVPDPDTANDTTYTGEFPY